MMIDESGEDLMFMFLNLVRLISRMDVVFLIHCFVHQIFSSR